MVIYINIFVQELSVPLDRAAACLTALHTQGYDRAAIIGTVQPPAHPGEPITIVGL